MNPADTRLRDLPSAILLVLALAVASQRLAATNWMEDLGLPFLLVLAAVLLGLLLGLSRFRGGVAALLALLYSLLALPLVTAARLYPGVEWLERMASMGGRLAHSAGVLAARLPLEDPFLLLATFCLVYWFIGLGSGFALTRRGSFGWAALPGGGALLLIGILDPPGDPNYLFLALYIFLALLLLGRINYSRRRSSWKAWKLFSSSEARADMNLAIVVSAALLVLVAWLVPIPQRGVPVLREWWQDLTAPWRKSEGITNVIAGLEIEDAAVVNEFFGRSLGLGQEANQGSSVYFRIQVTGVGGQERYYWRIRSYNLYDGGLWQGTLQNERAFQPRSSPLRLPERAGLSAEFDIRVIDTTAGLLVTPARPTWLSRPARLVFQPLGEDMVDPLYFRAGEAVRPGEEYSVLGILMEPTVLELRQAGTDYPGWVTATYLQLPEDLPPAIAALAAEIAGELPTPYDQAAAITAWLREEITYSLTIPSAPAGRDALAWFLFDYQQGFCNYYATAEVVMLRSLGIPARLVVGFSEGEYSSPGWYTIRQKDSHAWPEAWFPGFGWVEFEPTASQPELVRPSGEVEPTPQAVTPIQSTPVGGGGPEPPAMEEGLPPGTTGEGETGGGGNDTIAVLLAFFFGSLLVTGLLAWAYIAGAFDRLFSWLRRTFHAPAPILARDWLERNQLPVPSWLRRQAWLAGLSPTERLYLPVYQALQRLRVETPLPLTPAEAARALQERLPEAEAEVRLLLGEYQPAFYGKAIAPTEALQQAGKLLRARVRRCRWQELLGWRKRAATGVQSGPAGRSRGEDDHGNR